MEAKRSAEVILKEIEDALRGAGRDRHHHADRGRGRRRRRSLAADPLDGRCRVPAHRRCPRRQQGVAGRRRQVAGPVDHPLDARCRARCPWLRCPRARALRVMPTTRRYALSTGAITADHARLLAYAQQTNPEAFAEDGEARLLECAAALSYSQFEVAVRYWRHRKCLRRRSRRRPTAGGSTGGSTAPRSFEEHGGDRRAARSDHRCDRPTGAERLAKLEFEADLARGAATGSAADDVPLDRAPHGHRRSAGPTPSA